MRLELTIPCYNEEHRLEAGVGKLVDWIQRHPEHHISVVLAENGSTDATPEIARCLVEASPVPMRLVQVGQAGLALALRASFDSSEADVIGYCDTDMATDLDHLDEVLKLFSRPEVVVVNGSRWMKGAVVTGRHWWRKVFSWALRKAMRRMLNVRATDVACGFKFARRSWYAEKSPCLFSEKFFLGAELLWHAEQDGVGMVEIPVRWADQPGSRIRVIPTMVAYWRESRRLKEQIRR